MYNKPARSTGVSLRFQDKCNNSPQGNAFLQHKVDAITEVLGARRGQVPVERARMQRHLILHFISTSFFFFTFLPYASRCVEFEAGFKWINEEKRLGIFFFLFQMDLP